MSVLKYKKNGQTYTLNTPSGSGGGSGHTILDTDDTEMTTRSNLKFGGDFEVSDDSENDITEVIPYELTSADLAEIITNPPSSSNQSSGSGSSSSGSNSGDFLSPSDIFSTTEKVIGVFADNKPIYQKTIIVDDITITNGATKAHDITNLKNVLSASGFVVEEDNDVSVVLLDVEGSNVVFKTNETWTTSDYSVCYVTIQYTKTSDSTATVNSTGITVNSTVTYLTTEQQVGAWIDGSPLFRKTLTGTTINSTEGAISTGLTGIGYIELVDFQVSNGSYRKNLLDSVSIKEDGTDIYMVADSDSLFKNKTFYATVLYTKSSGGSGE